MSASLKNKIEYSIDKDEENIDDLINRIAELSTLTKSILQQEKNQKANTPKKSFKKPKEAIEEKKEVSVKNEKQEEKHIEVKINKEKDESLNKSNEKIQQIKESKNNSFESKSKTSSSESSKSSRSVSRSDEPNSRAEFRSDSSATTNSEGSGSENSDSNNTKSESVSISRASNEDQKEQDFIVEEKDKTKDSYISNASNSSSETNKSVNSAHVDEVPARKKECKKKIRKIRKVIYVDEIPKEYAKFLRPVEGQMTEDAFVSNTDRKSISKSPIFDTRDVPKSSSPKPKYKIIPCECPDCYWTKLIKDSSMQVITI